MIFLLRPILLPLQHLSSLVWLAIATVLETLDNLWHGRAPFRMSLFFWQADAAGAASVPLVALISLFLGLTMALLTGYQLRKFGTVNLVPGLITVGFSRELGPLMTGITVAGRVGAAFTAELGTMTTSEEVEAIEAMGIGPLRFLVAPRVLASFLLLPCLNVVSNLAAMLGGAFVCLIHFNIPFRYFGELALQDIILRDIVSGVLKSFLFGLIVGLVSCYKGLAVTGGAAGVGSATTSAVVASITSVIAADTLFNIALVMIYE